MKRPRINKLLVLAAVLLLSSCGPTSSLISSSSQEEMSSSTKNTTTSYEESEDSTTAETTEPISSSSVSEESDESSSAESSSSESSKEESSSKESSVESSSEQSYEDSSESSYSSSSSEDEDAYKWNINLNLYGEVFQEKLGELMNATRTKTSSYDKCLSVGAKAAAYPNANSSTFIPFYRAPNDSQKATQSECNREHTWPNSRGGGSIENDPIVIRPTLTKDNSNRGNNFYGDTASNEWDPANCGYEAARGESARVILYAVTCYRKAKGLSLSNSPSDSTSAKTMGTLKTLLEWNRKYAPSEFEKTVNDRYDSMGYARNAFVDHPEFADYIYTANGYRTTPYGDGGGEDSSIEPVERTYYSKHLDMDTIDGNSFIIGSQDSTGVNYSSMTSTPVGENLPWYLTGLNGTYNDGKFYISATPESFKFEKQSSGKYTISSKGYDLYGYVCTKNSKTFYSIGMGRNESEVKASQSGATFSAISNEWGFTDKGNGEFLLQATSGVYLEYYKGSWCGYQNAPKINLSLFNPTPQTELM